MAHLGSAIQKYLSLCLFIYLIVKMPENKNLMFSWRLKSVPLKKKVLTSKTSASDLLAEPFFHTCQLIPILSLFFIANE